MKLLTPFPICIAALVAAALAQCAPVLVDRPGSVDSQIGAHSTTLLAAAKLGPFPVTLDAKDADQNAVGFGAANEAEPSPSMSQLGTRGLLSSLGEVIERIPGTAVPLSSHSVEDTDRVAPDWHRFLNPDFKLDFKPTAAFEDALSVVKLRFRTKRGWNVSLAGLSSDEIKEYKKSRRVLEYYANPGRHNEKRRMKTAATHKTLRELDDVPSWVLALDPEIQANLKRRLGGHFVRAELSPKQIDAYDKAYMRFYQQTARPRKNRRLVADPSNSLPRAELVAKRPFRSPDTASVIASTNPAAKVTRPQKGAKLTANSSPGGDSLARSAEDGSGSRAVSSTGDIASPWTSTGSSVVRQGASSSPTPQAVPAALPVLPQPGSLAALPPSTPSPPASPPEVAHVVPVTPATSADPQMSHVSAPPSYYWSSFGPSILSPPRYDSWY